MIPKYVITGTPKEEFARKVTALFEKYGVGILHKIIPKRDNVNSNMKKIIFFKIVL